MVWNLKLEFDISCILCKKYCLIHFLLFKGELENLIYHKNILFDTSKSKILLEDKIYVIGPGPWLRPPCRDQERDFVQKSSADAIFFNINICTELLILSFENFNGTVSDQEKSFFHIPENKMFLQTRGRRWWRGSCCASTQDELQTKVTQHFLE